ncbi:MAG: hypothetical protein AB7P04_06660 [Bacteriovoracia bacterium]
MHRTLFAYVNILTLLLATPATRAFADPTTAQKDACKKAFNDACAKVVADGDSQLAILRSPNGDTFGLDCTAAYKNNVCHRPTQVTTPQMMDTINTVVPASTDVAAECKAVADELKITRELTEQQKSNLGLYAAMGLGGAALGGAAVAAAFLSKAGVPNFGNGRSICTDLGSMFLSKNPAQQKTMLYAFNHMKGDFDEVCKADPELCKRFVKFLNDPSTKPEDVNRIANELQVCHMRFAG